MTNRDYHRSVARLCERNINNATKFEWPAGQFENHILRYLLVENYMSSVSRRDVVRTTPWTSSSAGATRVKEYRYNVSLLGNSDNPWVWLI